jgi:hypothetical protein
MHGRTNILRLLSLGLLTGVFVLVLGTLGDAAEQKDKDKPKARGNAVTPKTAGTKLDRAALSRLIDEEVNERLKAEKVQPSGLADDAEFMRRAYLDILGHIPTAEQAAKFLDSKDADKRSKLIDELLASTEYGKHMADIWQALLLPRNSDNRRLDPAPLVGWLEDHFNKNTPWDKTVHELVTATGDADKNGAVIYFAAQGTVDKMTDNVTKVFLGVQLQCAQCHNHPFTEWKQTEYWGMAAFFMKVQATAPQKAAKNNEAINVTEVDKPKRGKNALPESAKILPPKFLGGENPKVGSGPARPVLADWMTTASNPFFAKAMVNRTWSQFMGRGLVNPVDDMHDGNHASHPQLLAELTEQFSANNFDVKFLIRAVCNSEAYQRTSRPNDTNKDSSPAIYARMGVKVMSGEQLVDSIALVVGPPARGPQGGRPGGGKGPVGNQRTQLVTFFGGDEGADPTEYQDGIPQVLRLMNNAQLNRSPKLNEIVKASKSTDQAIEQIYLATLSRRPTKEELARDNGYLKKVGTTDGYGDLLWAILNSSEFRVNR